MRGAERYEGSVSCNVPESEFLTQRMGCSAPAFLRFTMIRLWDLDETSKTQKSNTACLTLLSNRASVLSSFTGEVEEVFDNLLPSLQRQECWRGGVMMTCRLRLAKSPAKN
eukprot:scaffold198037_cov41-Cyclotella_meneghiniana.AAC.1